MQAQVDENRKFQLSFDCLPDMFYVAVTDDPTPNTQVFTKLGECSVDQKEEKIKQWSADMVASLPFSTVNWLLISPDGETTLYSPSAVMN